MKNIHNINPLVSVVIPVYNRTNELKRAIQSVLDQSLQKFEIVVVDDGSSENIKSVCDCFNDDRIRFFRYEAHKNANKARNIGIFESRGEFIAMLDSDDEFLPLHLERRMKKMEEWNCDGIFGSSYINEENDQKLILSRPLSKGELMINYLLSDGFAPTPSHVYRKKAAQNIFWDETLDRHQDFDFTVRFSNKYRFLSDYEPSIIIHWEQKNVQELNFDSCIEFIRRYENLINPKIYCDYHRDIYFSLANVNRQEYLSFYALNSYKYIQFVSFNDFLVVHTKYNRYKIMIFSKFLFLFILYFFKIFGKKIFL